MSSARKSVTGGVYLVERVAASRSSLFRACSTTWGLEGWYADVVHGKVATGQSLKLEWPDVGATMEVQVLEVAPDERVVFQGRGTRVVLEVADQVLRLSHEGVPESAVDGLQSSWKLALSLLAHGLEWHPGKRRTAHWALRPVNVTPELVHLCFTEPEALRRWLGESTGFGKKGDAFWLVWGEAAMKVSGHVLAESQGRDVALSMNELDRAVLALRTLPSGTPGCHVALCWSSWGSGVPRDVRAELERALERLSGLLAQSGAG